MSAESHLGKQLLHLEDPQKTEEAEEAEQLQQTEELWSLIVIVG